MKLFRAFVLSTLLFAAVTAAHAQKKLVVIGSSTSACASVNSVSECYVGRLRTFYDQSAPQDTVIDGDLALAGTNCYNGMPTTYNSPYPDPYRPITDRNISTALDAAHNPSLVLVNYPSNGYDVLSVTDIMYCLRTIRDSANVKGVPCFVTTTQPRTSPSSFNTPAMKRKLAEIKDSVLLQFGNFAIDFWTGLINPADSSILYDSGDQIHMNATGHNIMYQRVLAKNIFLATLPATFVQYNAINKGNTNIINWTTAKESGISNYEIQRSVDGRSFSKIAAVFPNNNPGTNQYQYTDDQPFKGWNYYKIVIVDQDGKKQPSQVMRAHLNTGVLAVIKSYARTANQVVIKLENNNPQTVQLQILNSQGVVISSSSHKIEAGNTMLNVTTPLLSNGVYHIKLISPRESTVGSFIKN